MINIDIQKARAIHKERLRRARAIKLTALDVDFLRAIETNTSTEAIIAEKNRLRSITDEVDDAATIEELKNIQI